MKNLIELRQIAGIDAKILAKLLNITVHTYNAFEQGKMSPAPEIIIMISLMYRIDGAVLVEPSLCLSRDVTDRLLIISKLSEDEKYIYLSSGILEKNVKPNYHNIKKVKEEIRKSLIDMK